ncbi:hypothetical protein [Leisingera methylohalidivorans]|uniref:Uncharacterized protein n=1 Tax=Leisingera methylohalidivorans DSM 14336 TaxID=999552 RepID=V9VUS5_9RHOB|nr:hypothetical protein [Leisingera methylohalidivorans]AHD02501.1 hypothetical protein METH_19370 [Leisingera methylohalidivorans DSM 14336]
MAQTQGSQPHRKFIALIVAASIAITGFSAAPARADEDVAKFIAGMALLGILGAAINDARKDDDHTVTRTYNPPRGHGHGDHRHNSHKRYGGHVKPLPPRLHRYDLPAQCVRYFPRYSRNYPLAGKGCLDRNYGYTQNLPRACKVTFWNGNRNHTGYKPRCLNQHGYRMVNR